MNDKESIDYLRDVFAEHFSDCYHGPFVASSAPGRMEIAGNHVDHQGGRVISAAVTMKFTGIAALNGQQLIRVYMDGFGLAVIDLTDPDWMEPAPQEYGTSQSIIRGMVASYAKKGIDIQGFDMVTMSTVPVGCGLSSSAAFEMLLGVTTEALFGENGIGEDASEIHEFDETEIFFPADPPALALDGQKVEQDYFGKLCGAQDQLASACGGCLTMDFKTGYPEIRAVPFAVDSSGYKIFLIDSRCDHAQFTDEYSAVPQDMFKVAEFFGCERLVEVGKERFFSNFGKAREALGDRAVLRAIHYFDEVERVDRQLDLLEKGDFQTFLELVLKSGMSSAEYLQNVSSRKESEQDNQPTAVILALCSHILGNRGAWRIHGGGFGGSVLVFVPEDQADEFKARLDKDMGYEACMPVAISEYGACARRIS